ncbi:MAG: hypothetical protein K6A77_12710 [Clostridiales bacterium]|nr:hypothetical protein [Clostridiales bacterium]
MQQVDIRRLFSILAEYQKMDPDTSEKLFQRILKVIIRHYDIEGRENDTP